MSGADESNDDLVSGRVNRANDQTTIWAENAYTSFDPIPGGSVWTDFNGSRILVVEVAQDSENSGDASAFKPSSPLDAIVGVGWSAQLAGQSGGIGVTGIGGEVGGTGVVAKGGESGRGLLADAGGDATGVVGLGGPREGTGVFGLGSGGERLLRHGRGGTGVHGVGGHAHLQPGPNDVPPGVGVFGQGGRIVEENRDGVLLGTGVIGVGGDAGNKDMPAAADAGSVGVFGQGADASVKMIVEDDGTTVFDGPAEPGAGLVGRGGLMTGPRPGAAAGVIGLAGGQSKPGFSETQATGVFGLGQTGVRGVAVSDPTTPAGPGVSGSSDSNRGGVFASQEAAQLQLSPQRVRTKFPPATTVTPTAIPLGALREGAISLPKSGQAGDLMTLLDDARLCTLWFCVRGADDTGPAQWAQVLLGPSFPGQS